MRDIKFRAWNGTDYMTNPFTLLDIQNGKIQFAPSDTVVMQYTSLKDKNGKEIYEGDKVFLFASSPTVIFKNGCFGYMTSEDEDELPEFIPLGDNHWYDWDENGKSEKVEVIGNIYENQIQ